MPEDVLIVGTIFGTAGWMVWTISNNIRRAKTAREVADLHSRLLDKFAASQELLAYVESGAGRQFLESAGSSTTNPAARILNAIQVGTVLTLVGIALLLVRSVQYDPDLTQFLIVCGAVALAVGVGFLLSALISFGLCKNWGLLNPAELRK